jgi:hypothetical protein
VAEYYVHGQLPVGGGFVTAMFNVATTTSADRENVATLTKAIVTLMDRLVSKYVLVTSKELELKRLLGGHAPTVVAITYGPTDAYVIKSYKTKNDNYCWSHDYQVGLAHTSAN